ncbi:related to BCH1 - Protein involved in transport at the trans-Golgi [Melanopsichium pennsylvanicum]|uniref:Related to BCH1 - Protein involved in transport at the trans-Golgi n=2 Tax=Melanopsichium pennsylvanicum TaxID=63383 RepID=A0AAJ4XSV0_9BASI|nr:related to BCH1-Protein involved in transport at the trans-Golgi [Melanopsichium pennsylvanicum 4]SNX86468.1 related to BCH1 - Protein involved in transport at the trans-Golgi [Melanopsichium pennsylvanicum]
MGDTFVSQPEFFEVELGESLLSRTETLASFRELGPPDLVHVIKSTGTGARSRDIGSYHYVSGVDASSSAALAAYINSLTYELDQNPGFFSSKAAYKLKSGAYCCFNAFSRVDVRVEVRIPGSVDAYVVDLRGERHETTPEIWQEVYLSALLRAILYADDANYRLAGYRKLDPISSPDAEHRFLQAAENLFFKGWQLGSDPEIQVATVVSNHLTAGILKYFGETSRYEQAVNLFEKLWAREPEVAALVAQSYIGMNEEIKAVQVMHSAVKETPQSYALLHAQVDFLRSKGKHEWALKVAKQAVNCAPSEFVTWAKLTECYIDLEQWESALYTLNSCPMFTYNERDLHRMPTPARSHLPVKTFIAESGLVDEESARDNEADVALLRLPAPALRGTFAKAYALLGRLVSSIGWDELLRYRSNVFVMEEEYRAQKAAATQAEDGVAEDDASIRGVAPSDSPAIASSTPPQPSGTSTGAKGLDDETDDGVEQSEDEMDSSELEPPYNALAKSQLGINSTANASSQSIPTIKISTESDHEREQRELEDYMKSMNAGSDAKDAQQDASRGSVQVEPPPLEKPAQASAGHERSESTSTAVPGDLSATSQNGANGKPGAIVNGEHDASIAMAEARQREKNTGFSFRDKRLCERWLDNLFMVLYEDLRVYTIWRAEIAHFRNQNLAYRKTGTEWEILGELGLRLLHKDEARDAFQRCVDVKFSAKAYLRLLEIYTEARDVQRSLWTAIRLTAYHHRWYMEGSFPGAVATSLFKLIKTEGLAKVSYTLVSMSPPQGILKLMQNYFAYASAFKVPGYDF